MTKKISTAFLFEGVCLTAVILAFARGWGGSAWGCLTPYPGTPPVSAGLRRMSSKNRDLIDRLQTSASWTTPVSISYICLVSTADICPVSAADICPVSTADICPVSTEDIYPVSAADFWAVIIPHLSGAIIPHLWDDGANVG